eukprot:TRINITY_DN15558_c1_g3_i2.p1 TRINITY_DN15558_c1_g3~~TRINITY_DN15558_c1_g3_i2.p1  ORF type:complete len:471 (-),score=58.74 TRINITY_DN15558_c1_g3_i2:130-1542(-)
MVLLQLNGTDKSVEADDGAIYALPVFVLHSVWMILVAFHIGESRGCCDSESDGVISDDESSPDSAGVVETEQERETHTLRESASVRHLRGRRNLPSTLDTALYLNNFRLTRGMPQAEKNRLEEAKFDHQPAQIVRTFTLSLAALWLLAGGIHAYRSLRTYPASANRRLLSTHWPEPASLFEVASLHCASSSLFVQNDFSLYSIDRSNSSNESLGPGTMSEMRELRRGSSIFCGDCGCSVLIPPEHPSRRFSDETDNNNLGIGGGLCDDSFFRTGAGGACSSSKRSNHSSSSVWRLQNFASSTICSSDSLTTCNGMQVALPSSWRAVSASWEDDECGKIARIAGWNGTTVTIAEMHRTAGLRSASWHIQPRLVLHGRGLLRIPELDSEGQNSDYEDVRAVQLGHGGRSLTLLRSFGVLEAWDLDSEKFLGRWRLGRNYSAMCHDGATLHLSHASAGSPPTLEALSLPSELF